MSSRRTMFGKGIIFTYANKITLFVAGFLYTYLIANYLGPSDYGLVSYYMAFITSVINTGGINFLQSLYNVFVPRSKSKSFFVKVLRWQYYLAAIFFLSVFVFSERIALFLNKDEFLFLRWAALLLLLLPLHDSFIFLFRGFKLFGKILKEEIVVSFTNVCLAFLFVVSLSYGIYGVIYARILSVILGILVFALFFRRLDFKNRVVSMIEVKNYSYSAFMVTLFRGLTDFSFTVFLGLFVSTGVLGLYYIAQKLVGYIVSSFQSSISEVIIPFVAEDYNDNHFLNKYLSYSLKLILILSSSAIILLILLGKPMLALLLPKYVEAYDILILYSIVVFFTSFSVLHSAFMTLNRMNVFARICFYDLIMVITFSLLLMPVYGIYGALFSLILMGIVHIALLLHYLKVIGLNIDFIIRVDDVKYFYGLFRVLWCRLMNIFKL